MKPVAPGSGCKPMRLNSAAKNSAAALRIAKANRAALREVVATLDEQAAARVTAALGPDLDEPVVRAEDVPDPNEDDEQA